MGKQISFVRKPARYILSLTLLSLGCLFSGAPFVGSIASSFGSDSSASVANIDSSLQHLVDNVQTLPLQNSAMSASTKNLVGSMTQSDAIRLRREARFDEQGRALVHVHLDGTQSMETIERVLTSLDAKVLSRMASYRHGMVAAYLPIGQILTLASTAGVSHLTAEHPPKAWAGRVTSQGTIVLRTDLVNKN